MAYIKTNNYIFNVANKLMLNKEACIFPYHMHLEWKQFSINQEIRNLSTGSTLEVEAGISLGLRSAWPTDQVLG